ncbi:MAG: hypothetical protein AB1656_03475 [Candidatus Omnitrophota bacterium]
MRISIAKTIDSIQRLCFMALIAIPLISPPAFGVPPGYIGINGFCEYSNTRDEYIELWWPSLGLGITQDYWENTIVPALDVFAQTVDVVTIGLATAPFFKADNATPWTNGAPWSDTWGVCAFFCSTGCHINSDLANAIIRDVNDINAWDTATRGSVPESTYRVVGVADIYIQILYAGITKPCSRLSLIRKYNIVSVSAPYAAKVFLHEWGHTYEPYFPSLTVNDTGMYQWPSERTPPAPPFEGYHYGEYVYATQNRIEQSCFNWNIMHWDGRCGWDGDWNWRFEKYPWLNPYYNSFRWDQNY